MKIFYFLSIFLILTGCESYDLQIDKSYILKKGGFEPSGVTVFNNSFYIIGDEGRIAVLKKDKIFYKKLKKRADLEGITNDKESLYAIDEIKGIIYKIDNLKITQKYKIPKRFDGRRIFKKGKDGFEGIAFLKEDENGKHFVLSVQSNKTKLLFVSIKKGKAEIEKLKRIKPKDVSGLFYKDGVLYLISDKEDRLYLYRFKDFKLLKKYKIPGKNQEGIAVLNNRFLIADDSGRFFIMSLK